MKSTSLESVPLGVTTLTSPVVAPVGTVVVISELDTTVNLAAVSLKLTLVAPVRSVPRILTAAPTLPEPGCASTNGLRPTDTLKTVPQMPVQRWYFPVTLVPLSVVPYKVPLVSWIIAFGSLPSVLSKLCNVASVPLGVIRKTVPYPLAPPPRVVP